MRMFGELKEFLGRFGQFWEENFYRILYSGLIRGESGEIPGRALKCFRILSGITVKVIGGHSGMN
jgi:hypothetical protein